MEENKDKIYLERIMEAIVRIETHLSGIKFDHFESDDKTYDAVLMQFINIGELVNSLSDEFIDNHSEFPWHQIIGMRNQITHGYFEIKADEIWKTAIEDLPVLKKDIKTLM